MVGKAETLVGLAVLEVALTCLLDMEAGSVGRFGKEMSLGPGKIGLDKSEREWVGGELELGLLMDREFG